MQRRESEVARRGIAADVWTMRSGGAERAAHGLQRNGLARSNLTTDPGTIPEDDDVAGKQNG